MLKTLRVFEGVFTFETSAKFQHDESTRIEVKLMPNRQILVFTLAFLTAALTAAAVVLLLRRPRRDAVLDEAPLPEIDPDTSGGDWLPAADDPDAWWGTR